MEWDKAKTELVKKLNPKYVKPAPQGKYGEYIEGWHVIAEANRIFGFGEWSDTYTHELVAQETNPKGNHVITYIAKAHVEVGGIVREGFGSGEGIAKTIGAAHEGAIKEAETDALKRALRKFGNAFGLALYDKQKANVGIDEPTDDEKAATRKKTAQRIADEIRNANGEFGASEIIDTKMKMITALYNGDYPAYMIIHDAAAEMGAEIIIQTKESEAA